MKARMSLMGLYDYDNTILDDLAVPEGLDVSILKDNLLIECGYREILYPRPDFFKMALRAWVRKNIGIWAELYDTTLYEYNPIENYDRKEDNTYIRTDNLKQKNSGTDSTEYSGTDSTEYSGTDSTEYSGTDSTEYSGKDITQDSGTDSTQNSGSDTTLNKAHAFNTSGLADSNSSTLTNGLKQDVTHGKKTELEHGQKIELEYGQKIELEHGQKIELEHGQKIELEHGLTIDNTGTQTNKEVIYAHGNIGTVSTQDMIKQQREVVEFNVYDYIIRDFQKRFILGIY